MKKYIPCKWKAKESCNNGVINLISEKVDLKIKNTTKDKEGHYIMIKDQSKRKT